MRRTPAFLLRLAGAFRKDRRDRELADEIESHLQLHIEDNLRAGMTIGQINALVFTNAAGAVGAFTASVIENFAATFQISLSFLDSCGYIAGATRISFCY
jgi:hypothetical protein